MLNLYAKSITGDYFDPIDMEVNSDIDLVIKRKIRLNLLDMPAYVILSPDDTNMIGVETFGGTPSGNVFSTGKKVIGTVKPYLMADDGEYQSCGCLLLLKGNTCIPDMNMGKDTRDSSIDFMLDILRIQQWLEGQGILNCDPKKDKEDMRILVEYIDEKPVARILSNDEQVDFDYSDEN